MFLDNEEHIWYEHCLQCGYTRELKDIAEFCEQSPSPVKEEPAQSPVKDTTDRAGLKERVALRSGRHAGRKIRA